jgi:hypothetical protein
VTTVTGTGPAEMKLLSAKLRGADAELVKNLRKQLRREATPSVTAVKASVAGMPSHHDGTLRKQLARTVSARTSIRKGGVTLDVVSAGRRMPAGKQNLTGYTDQATGWDHPVYGHRKTWRHQVGKPGWFEVPVSKRAPAFRAAAQRAIDDVKRKLA